MISTRFPTAFLAPNVTATPLSANPCSDARCNRIYDAIIRAPNATALISHSTKAQELFQSVKYHGMWIPPEPTQDARHQEIAVQLAASIACECKKTWHEAIEPFATPDQRHASWEQATAKAIPLLAYALKLCGYAENPLQYLAFLAHLKHPMRFLQAAPYFATDRSATFCEISRETQGLSLRCLNLLASSTRDACTFHTLATEIGHSTAFDALPLQEADRMVAASTCAAIMVEPTLAAMRARLQHLFPTAPVDELLNWWLTDNRWFQGVRALGLMPYQYGANSSLLYFTPYSHTFEKPFGSITIHASIVDPHALGTDYGVTMPGGYILLTDHRHPFLFQHELQHLFDHELLSLGWERTPTHLRHEGEYRAYLAGLAFAESAFSFWYEFETIRCLALESPDPQTQHACHDIVKGFPPSLRHPRTSATPGELEPYQHQARHLLDTSYSKQFSLSLRQMLKPFARFHMSTTEHR